MSNPAIKITLRHPFTLGELQQFVTDARGNGFDSNYYVYVDALDLIAETEDL